MARLPFGEGALRFQEQHCKTISSSEFYDFCPNLLVHFVVVAFSTMFVVGHNHLLATRLWPFKFECQQDCYVPFEARPN
jgi:hypothetical protein